ncbi:MAG: ABC transporter ATP-binding protein [Gammaproteobacteria bacterium]
MHALEISRLTKTYKNGVQALKGIDLTVEQGEFFALLGPNGAGKSTTIGIISSLVNKTSGRVMVQGLDMDQHLEEAKACIGLVPQEINFSQFETVIDIVVNQAGFYGVKRSLALERAEKYLSKLGLWEKRNDRSRTLSGGMKRRLMIARALLHEPSLLILDEPTAGVDIELRRSLWDFLREMNANGRTIILTTHYLEEAESLCRNIAIIDKGRIIENTSMKRLLSQLNVETFILDLRHPMTEAPTLDNYTLTRIDDSTLSVDITKDRSVNDLFAQLSARGIEVMSMRNKVNRLEELFVRLLAENGTSTSSAAAK